MSAVFLDTVGLLGLWDEDDQWHRQASEVFDAVEHDEDRLFTTSYVIAECANATSRWSGRGCVETLAQTLEATGGVIFPSDADWHEAWTRYTAGHAGAPGLVDELSFIIMRRLGLHRAFTNDAHFRTAGFEVLF